GVELEEPEVRVVGETEVDVDLGGGAEAVPSGLLALGERLSGLRVRLPGLILGVADDLAVAGADDLTLAVAEDHGGADGLLVLQEHVHGRRLGEDFEVVLASGIPLLRLVAV